MSRMQTETSELMQNTQPASMHAHGVLLQVMHSAFINLCMEAFVEGSSLLCDNTYSDYCNQFVRATKCGVTPAG